MPEERLPSDWASSPGGQSWDDESSDDDDDLNDVNAVNDVGNVDSNIAGDVNP